MHAQTQSPVLALLNLPAIGGCGVEQSIVFAHLPEQAQAAIRSASNEQQKCDIAARAGDDLPVISQMFNDLIAGPAERAHSGEAFPGLARLGDFPLPGVLRDCDRIWLRPGQTITSIETQPSAGGWSTVVSYADGSKRHANEAIDKNYPEQASAVQRTREVHRAAFILGLVPTEPAAG